MQREIKFRGKHIHVSSSNKHLDGRWIYGSLIICSDDENYIFSKELEGEFLVDENTVGQYTGLKDKNGKEIYEYDECEVYRTCVYARGYIKFHQGCFIFEEFKTGNILRLCDLEFNKYTIKVTGTVVDKLEVN